MRYSRLVVAAIAGSLLTGSAVLAQDGRPARSFEERVRAAYEEIDGSIVRVRTTAELEYTELDPRSGLRSLIRRPLAAQGTGVVVGRTFSDGQWEYLILTNHHVADVSNYVIQEGAMLRENRHNTIAVPTVPEESFLLLGEEPDPERDLLLIEVARHVQGDMTLMRTVGATGELIGFPYRIGFRDGEVAAGASVVTSGFPNGGGKIFAVGRVVETDRLHTLGLHHNDFIIDIPVEHGQSGSPVFLAEPAEDGDGVSFTLIGLMHASEHGETYMVPYTIWAAALEAEGTMLERLVR